LVEKYLFLQYLFIAILCAKLFGVNRALEREEEREVKRGEGKE